MIASMTRWLAILSMLVVAVSGCKKSTPETDNPQAKNAETPQAKAPDLAASVHWLGKKQAFADTNYAYLTGIWSMPESARLEAQTLDKLALAPWRDTNDLTRLLSVTNFAPLVEEHPQARLLRPLLQEAWELGCVFEVSRDTNQPAAFALAIKLPEGREVAWKTNLAAVATSLPAYSIQVEKSGPWTLVGWTAGKSNAVLASMPTRMPSSNAPAGTNYLVRLFLDLQRLLGSGSVFANTALATNLPSVSLTVAGDGEYLRTRGTANFRTPPPLKLEPWLVPTNLIKEPLTSFCAFQGIQPLLEGNPWLKYYHLGSAPNQYFTWSLRYSPVHLFLAMLYPGASFWMETSGPEVPEKSLGWLTNYARGTIEYVKQHNALEWKPMPIVSPILEARRSAGNEYLLARLSAPLPQIGSNAPSALLEKLSGTNLIYYDWELTDSKLEQWFLLGQSLRLLLWYDQLPRESASTGFILAAGPKLGNSVTEIRHTGPGKFTIARGSHIGLTGMELHLLADWLESPSLPLGIHTTKAPGLPRDSNRAR